MAVVGEASIIVRAVTTGVKNDIQRAFNGADGIGERAGADAGAGFSRGFQRSSGDVAQLFGRSLSQADVDRFTAARKQFLSLARVGYVLATSLTGLGGIVGSLVGGLGALISITAGATPALLGLSGAFLAVAASAAVLRATFGGVTEAIQAGAKVGQNEVARAAQLKAANERLADAYYNVDEAVRQAAERKAQAVEAESDAAQAVADAAISVERAERSYRDAVKGTEKALEDVTKAREEAKEAIQQLRFELEGGVISEKKARLEFEKARDSLQRVQDLPPNSRARREAELAFAEADLNLRKAIDKNNDLRKANAKANKEGVDGNERVVAAQERLVAAKQTESDAQLDAARSVISYKEAIEDLEAARARLIKGGEVDRENARALELAYRELANAKAAVKEAEAPTGLNDFQAALDKLSPAAQDFVKYILSLKDAFEELRKKLQEAFFPKFTEAVKLLVETLLPALEASLISLAAKLGELSLLFAEAFTTPKKVEELKTIFESFTPIIDALGRALIDLASAYITLQAAFTPYTIEFVQFLQKKAEALRLTIELKEATGELNQIFKDSTDIVRGLGEAFGNTFSAIGTIIAASIGPGSAGEYFITWLKEVTKNWEETTKALSETGELQTFILNLTKNFTQLLEVIGLIAIGLLQIAASPGFGEFLKSIEEATRNFNELGLELSKEGGALSALGELIVAISKLTLLITESESITIFFKTLTLIIEGLVFVLDNPFGKALLAVTGAMLALSAAVGLANTALTFYARSVGGAILATTGFIDKGLMLAGIYSGPASKAVKSLRQELVFLTYGLEFVNKRFIMVTGSVGIIIATFLLLYTSSEKLREALKGLAEGVLKQLEQSWKEIKDALDKAFESVGGVTGVFKLLGDFLAITLVPLLEFTLVAAIKIVAGIILEVIETIQSWTDKFSTLKRVATEVKDKLVEVFGKINELSIGDIFDGLKTGFKSAINYVIDKWNDLKFQLKLPDEVFGIPLGPLAGKGFTINTPNIPKLAQGGVVSPTAGGVLATIAEAGRPERVEPLDPSGLSRRDRAMIEMLAGPYKGVNITINPSQGMDERELAALVSRQLAFQLRKGAA
jgi:hypothetical protein